MASPGPVNTAPSRRIVTDSNASSGCDLYQQADVTNKVERDRDYGFKGRLVWKRFVSAQDCMAEYEKWRSKSVSTTVNLEP
jgi:hypothetical protein